MQRKLMMELVRWKDKEDRKPLILEGARQVGKTYLLKEFGEEHYKNIVYLNFQNPSEELVNIFSGSIEAMRIISALEVMLNEEIKPGETLLIFDEIQELPSALTSLKYFFEDAPEYHVVSAGSLLGIFLHPGTSFPVGKVNKLRLEPMDFEEFLWANGREELVRYMKADKNEIVFVEILTDLFREYLMVGGMPEAVGNWVENKNVENVDRILGNILDNYRGDFSKHTDETTAVRIRQVFDSLPAQFAKNNDKFVYGVARAGARGRDYELAIEWLIDAGIVRRVTKVTRGDKLPVRAYEERTSFKLYFLDVGLFRKLADIPTKIGFAKSAIFDEYNGLIAEQYVCQQLADRKLFYWTSESESEVDFITQIGGDVVPIEVKSGTNVKAKSLRFFREKYKTRFAVRFSLLPLKYDAGLLNIPLYTSWKFDALVQDYLRVGSEWREP